jgi:hypothetical protein
MLAKQTWLSALTASMQAEQLGPGGSRSSEKAMFKSLRQLLQAHPLNGQTALHAAAFLVGERARDEFFFEHTPGTGGRISSSHSGFATESRR